LHVVHGWQLPAVRLTLIAAVATDVEAAARRVLDAALDDAALSGLDVVGHLPRLRGPEAVLTHAEHAALIVTGSRGLGRLAGTLLGSTTRQLAHHAPCPIVVVPPVDR
jgi:nucleotide-binding universal stress UspA family protein